MITEVITLTDKDKQQAELQAVSPAANHIGGVNDQMGGVDPDIDNDLMRLAGGP